MLSLKFTEQSEQNVPAGFFNILFCNTMLICCTMIVFLSVLWLNILLNIDHIVFVSLFWFLKIKQFSRFHLKDK